MLIWYVYFYSFQGPASRKAKGRVATVEAVIGDEVPRPALHADDPPTMDAAIGDEVPRPALHADDPPTMDAAIVDEVPRPALHADDPPTMDAVIGDDGVIQLIQVNDNKDVSDILCSSRCSVKNCCEPVYVTCPKCFVFCVCVIKTQHAVIIF